MNIKRICLKLGRIKSIININKKEKKDINCLKVDHDQQATDPFVISNYFNKFFTTIAKNIEGQIVQTDNILRLP